MNYPDYDEKNIKVLKVDTFIEMMVQLKEKPEMFLGSDNKCFTSLSSFISGYTTAKWDEGYTSFLYWLGFNITTSSSPLKYIEEAYK